MFTNCRDREKSNIPGGDKEISTGRSSGFKQAAVEICDRHNPKETANTVSQQEQALETM